MSQGSERRRKAKSKPEPQMGPLWEHTEEGWWVVENFGMLRTGPFASKDRARQWFYQELGIVLEIP
jgi:hypothetical protein